MIDARFIEAKRRAAKTGDAPSGHRRRRPGHRGGGGDHTPSGRTGKTEPEDPDFSRDSVPLMGNKTLFTAPSPQTQFARPQPVATVTHPRKDENKSQNKANIMKPQTAMESLEATASNLSIRDGSQSPKQGRHRGRNRGRSNVSKNSSPQRTFHGRPSAEEQRSGNKPPVLNTRPEAKMEPPKGMLPISIPNRSSPKATTTAPIVRLPEVIHPPPASEVSHDTSHLIRSSDTDFGSDISRGAVQGGRLYDHRTDKSSPKLQQAQKAENRQHDDKPPPQTRGLLPIQPGKMVQTNQSSVRRGGLLIIDKNAVKPNNAKPNKAKGNQTSDFNRNAVPLRKEDGKRRIWNPDEPDDDSTTMLHERPRVEVTLEFILREVKSAYQEIQNLERKVKAAYDEDDTDISRNQAWQSFEVNQWPSLARTHRELLEYYHTFFIMTQHPVASNSIRRLPKRHDILARYWKFGIVEFLEHLRRKLPSSQSYMESFIFGAYSLTSVLLQDVPVFQAVWMECLGDLARYLFAIEIKDETSKEHWREVARDWYLKTIDVGQAMEGRLFHHLGIISKGNSLLQLFYYSKSLMVVHGFPSARESFLILIDPFLGKKTKIWSDTFVRLHGMLFSRLHLDSFEDETDSFLNEVMSASLSQWAMLAIINIAALYQFNRRDSRLKEALRQGRREKREAENEEQPVTEDPNDVESILPASENNEDLTTDMANVDRAPDKFKNMPLYIRMDDSEDISLSKIVFDKACALSFDLLSEALNTGKDEQGAVTYVHIWLVFLIYALRYQPVVHLLERYIPWDELSEFLNTILTDHESELELLRALKEPSGPVLAEDTIMRGFDWDRKFFPKNWFQDVDPVEEIRVDQSESRSRRVLQLGFHLTKVCDCIEYIDGVGFRVTDLVIYRIDESKAREAEEARRREEIALAAKVAAMDEPEEEVQVHSESDEDADVQGENEQIRALKARRRELKALLNAQKPEPKSTVPATKSKKDKPDHQKALKPGYTTLVFDTNLLVSHLDLLKQVLECKEWQVVVPLIVINELDGLKINPPPLGPAAAEAIAYVEQSLLARRLRVLTQQGNGLSNLAFRSQQLLPRSTEDGAGSIDAFIIQTVKDQIERHTGKVPNAERAVLVTGDRSMRVIAKARGVQAVTAAELKREILRKEGPPKPESPKKKGRG